MPKVRQGKWDFRQLFVDGRRYIRAREPNEKDYWYRFARTLIPEKPAALCEPTDIKPWRAGDEVEATLLRTWDVSRFRVLSVDWDSLLMRFKVPQGIPVLKWWKGDRRYYLENSISFLDSPGEWFLDQEKGVLYLRALEGCDVGRAEIVAPAVDRLIRFEGSPEKTVRFLNFRGLTFRHGAWTLPEKGYDGHFRDIAAGGSIEGDFVQSCSFTNCRFEHLGRYAIWLREGCVNNVITRCEFTDLGGGAVNIGENKRSESGTIDHETASNEISHNYIHHCGKVWHGSTGICVGPANRTRIAHNHIHDLPYSGMAVGGFFLAERDIIHHNIIEYNYIHDVMQSMSDGGGIYTMGLQPGTVIRNNIIHDCPGWEPMHWAHGIYLDLHSSEIVIENNLVFRVGQIALVMGWPKRNIVRNNIFALAGSAMAHVKGGKDNLFERNLFVVENKLFDSTFDAAFIRLEHNLYFHVAGRPFSFKGKSFEKWRATGQDAHSIIADPRFADIKKGDLSLKSDTPALKIGFKPFKLPLIGPPRFDYSSRITASMRHKGPGRITTWPIPRIVAPAPSSKIVIDGLMTEKAWKDIPPVPLRETKVGPPHDPPLHYARVACDGQHLYAIIVTDVPDMAKLHADGSSWDEHDWAIVCFQGISDEEASPIFSVWGWASGSLRCFTHKNFEFPDKRKETPKEGILFAAKVGRNKWTAEWKIPLASFGINPGKVKELRFNMGVRRSDSRDKDRKWGMWVNPGSYVWHLRHAGLLITEKSE